MFCLNTKGSKQQTQISGNINFNCLYPINARDDAINTWAFTSAVNLQHSQKIS